MKRCIVIGLVLFLGACERSEFSVPIPIGGGGGSYSAPSRTIPGRTAPQSTPIAPPANPMIQDPENTFDENITVYADSATQAQRKCENVAKSRSQDAIAQCLGCRKMTKTTGRYSCTIRIEAFGGEQR